MLRHLAFCFCAILSSSIAHAETVTATFVRAGEAVLGNPHDIELSPDGKRLYVSDVDKNRIAILDSQSLKLIGSFGQDKLSSPHDVDLGADGRLYVADTGNDRIAIFKPDGAGARYVGQVSGKARRPEGVLVHPNGALIATGAWSGNIVRFADGKPVAQSGGLSGPHDVEVDGSGNIWIADANNDRLIHMSPEFKRLKVLSGPKYGFKGPRYLAIGRDGTLYAADKYTHRLLIIRPSDGEILGIIGNGKRGKGPGLLATPEGAAVRGDDLWISDSSNNRIVRYRLVRK